MSTKRTTITLPESLVEVAQAIMRDRHFEDFSGFLQQLIREESERRQAVLRETASTGTTPAQTPTAPVSYKKEPARRRAAAHKAGRLRPASTDGAGKPPAS